MKKERKEDLIDKLLNQQIIVQNSSSETDFRRAEVTAQIIKLVLELENAPESLELIGGLDVAKGSDQGVWIVSQGNISKTIDGEGIETVSSLLTASEFNNPAEANAEIALQSRRLQKTFKEKVIEAIKEAGKSLSSKEIREAINFEGSDSNLSAQINNILKHLTKSPNIHKTLSDRGRFLYGLKEWDGADSDDLELDKKLSSKIKEIKKSKNSKDESVLRKKHLRNFGAKTNANLVYKIEANDASRRLSVAVGDEVRFRNVLGTSVQGKIVAMNIPGRNSYKGEFHNEKTVTIEEDGSLFDRKLNQIVKVVK